MKNDKIKNLHTLMIPILSNCVKEVFENSLVSLALFGSVARGDYKLDSDIDIFITIEDIPKSRSERSHLILNNLIPLYKERGERIYPDVVLPELHSVLRDKAQVLEGGFLYLDLVSEAKILVDRDGFFENHLERFGKKMKEWGSQKYIEQDGYYWIVKPGLQNGEILDLSTKGFL
jgi:predicted nucleotidyltransferase